MNQLKTIFIYCLKDPATGEVRYIGKTDNLKKRFYEHLVTSSKKRGYLGNWLRGLSESPVIAVLHEVLETEFWQEEEKRYITCARALGMRLVNMTDGGEGASGPMRPGHREAIGDALRGVPKSPEHRAALGGPKSPEHRAALRGPKSPAHCAAIGVSQKGVPETPFSPEHCAALSAALRGVPKSPEHRAAMRVPHSPEHCAAMSAARKGVPWTAAQRAAYERRKGSRGAIP